MADLIDRQTATSNTLVSDTVKIPVMDGTTERLPSAQPERKTGRWIETKNDLYDYFICSECGTGVTDGFEFRFCPNCGTRMEEVDE